MFTRVFLNRCAAYMCMAALGLFAVGCAPDPAPDPVGSDGWLTGSSEEKFDTVADQLRGFDVAMWEVGYRYNELYWAGQDENWPYAEYHAEKIRTAMEQGFERRPAREASAEEFMNEDLPGVKEAINAEDPELFEERMEVLTNSCNICHALEEVPFMQVRLPSVRSTVIRMHND